MNKDAYFELKNTVEQAKKDLESGISRERLEDLYRKEFIKKSDYEEIKKSLDMLENIISMFEPMIIQYEEEHNMK